MEEEVKNSMYIGPSVVRIGLKARTLVKGSAIPPQLLSLIQTKPIIRSLYVPTSQVATAMANMKVRGTLENQAALEVMKFSQQKMINESIVKRG